MLLLAAAVLAPMPAFADDFPGSPGNDVLNGTDSGDTMSGEGGNDDIVGNGGNDDISGGDGGDFIESGSGDDTVRGDGGDDYIDGGEGNDSIDGGGSGDILSGGNGDDDIQGGPGDDIIFGDAGDDTLNGQGGNDYLCGGEGASTLTGGPGVDIACAVDDEVIVMPNEESSISLADNDEVLDDKGTGEGSTAYSIVTADAFLNAVIDAVTGVLSFKTSKAGMVSYAATNCGPSEDESQAEVCSTVAAFAFINVFGDGDPGNDDDDGAGGNGDDEGSDDGAEGDSDEAGDAKLPNTGAADSLTTIGALGIAFLLAGMTTLHRTRPRGRHVLH